MYADDIILFCKANMGEALVLNRCLDQYCAWSGQLLNRSKSGLIFSKLVSPLQKRRLKLELNRKSVPKQAYYLGSPLFTSKNRIKDFKFLNEKLETRLVGWRCKTLSWASRCTLIKVVAQALPTYTFSTFDVPTTV